MTSYIIAGTYTHAILGLELRFEPTESDPSAYRAVIKQRFGYAPHAGSVSALAADGPLLVSGSSDETLRVYNLARRVEAGTLMEQNGGITCVSTAPPTHVITGSHDGSLGVWSLGTWECERRLRAHKQPVTAVATHPSGRVALSCSRDGTLNLWDLAKGRLAHNSKFGTADPPRALAWSQDGSMYVSAHGQRLLFHSVSAGRVTCEVSCGSAVCSVVFVGGIGIAGCENGDLVFADPAEDEDEEEEEKGKKDKGKKKKAGKRGEARVSEPVAVIKEHEARVRCLATLPREEDSDKPPFLVSASSDGRVCVWQVDDEGAAVIAVAETGCRIVSLAASRIPGDPSDDSSEEEEEYSEESSDDEKELPDGDSPKSPNEGKNGDDDDDDDDDDETSSSSSSSSPPPPPVKSGKKRSATGGKGAKSGDGKKKSAGKRQRK